MRSADDYFDDIPDKKIDKEMIELAEHIVRQKAGHFDPSEFADTNELALAELLRRKQKGLPLEKSRPFSAPRAVNLTDALRKSLAAEKKRAAAVRSTKMRKAG